MVTKQSKILPAILHLAIAPWNMMARVGTVGQKPSGDILGSLLYKVLRRH